jgi:hypothetical protein
VSFKPPGVLITWRIVAFLVAEPNPDCELSTTTPPEHRKAVASTAEPTVKPLKRVPPFMLLSVKQLPAAGNCPDTKGLGQVK